MLKQLALSAVMIGLITSGALAQPLSDAQAVCKSHLKGENTLNIVGQPPVAWPAYDRPECDNLEMLTNKNIPPDPNRHLNERDVVNAVMALVTGNHPVVLNPLARHACVTQGYANIGVELAESAGNAPVQSAMSAASTDAGKACVW
jgi:hypothetical protein